MSVLLLRLAGPMQSWGVQSRFTVRDTGLEPSKSGAIGLCCAALGRRREEPLDDLTALRMGVRVDREGRLCRDFHTAGGGRFRGKPYGVAKASGAKPDTVVSNRYYLADADFLVGLEIDDEGLLAQIHQALGAPKWPLFLGRKAFVPGVPVHIPDGQKGGALADVLTTYPWYARNERGVVDPPEKLRLVLEVPLDYQIPADGHRDIAADNVRADSPISFVSSKRTFAVRRTITRLVPLPRGQVRKDSLCTSRD